MKISIHTLTQRVTDLTAKYLRCVSISIHTLTQRVTQRRRKQSRHALHFNPHPHAEGDNRELAMREDALKISIHTLTQRVTRDIYRRRLFRQISIHTLTQRVTDWFLTSVNKKRDFNPHPHAEGDYNFASCSFSNLHFNPHPHAEGDVNMIQCRHPYGDFNPHPHAEGDSVMHMVIFRLLKFQSTPSRRG